MILRRSFDIVAAVEMVRITVLLSRHVQVADRSDVDVIVRRHTGIVHGNGHTESTSQKMTGRIDSASQPP